ncbi:hypothetical protein A3A84_00210 [Candidatus Collierbacteria bacterium RIFCSPLOWO2_01_FULL_50_23]|uniref:MgtC/SapB/SrpB/YhiD N-terminal domain-containing protein n=2 Tax=Candidatus Collieribacteriota TaxID=1752725 RepID=A0A1F5EVD7_9BACT|nr:MAG: hypothetical protein A3D09_01065 [Candidatus Collierbacteria bacterium RIFCSPHIGHO2_02_FULL_49_10]OGD71446.1 MAG: hypothetical protein A2703_03010 [Candidatus Collierbacteria bacterium RIFCSPHIGHO2_01_FULL_50_25]OGD74524.1 MAG: hypothetical protein A3A84_00210 [Candidatus Collierbacteria bacterium RIFCSPLOWO2_01_FULL_50_23]
MNIQLEIILQVLLSFVVGMLIGFDRERSGKAAGMRTQMLVCVGSTLLAAISVHLAESYNASEPGVFRADPTRLMAQIVSGIGFLGAGVIIKNGGNKVSGVTTAATIWITAAIGIGIGSGFYLPAFVATGMVLLLNPIAYIQYRYGLKSDYYQLVVKTGRRSIAEKAIKYLHLAEKERKSRSGETMFKILSSNQRNEMLSELLDKKKVQYRLEVVED